LVRGEYSATLSTLQGYRIITVQRSGFIPRHDCIGVFGADEARLYTEHVVWHHSGTAALCGLVAAKMGLDPHIMREALQAALVHDMGKFFMPRECLWKYGRLDREEKAVMERHSAEGAEFLAHRGFSEEVVLAVRHHHERWDGTGYPDGLRGEEIPLLARVVGVCDALDAMTEGRHYAGRLGPQDIIKEIEAGAGSQFDPQVVRPVLEFLSRKGEALRV